MSGEDKGRIIFLNGVTGTGKTSIVRELMEREDIRYSARVDTGVASPGDCAESMIRQLFG